MPVTLFQLFMLMFQLFMLMFQLLMLLFQLLIIILVNCSIFVCISLRFDH